MKRIKEAIIDFLTDRPIKKAIEKSQRTAEEIELILNGKDEYFMILNQCPENDADEKECPPDFS